jgi:hypothetical protein
MNHISKYFQKYTICRAFYKGLEIQEVIHYLQSGRLYIRCNDGLGAIINREELIII